MNVSKPVFVSAILLSFLSAIMISQVFNAIAIDGGGNPFDTVWEAIEDLQSQIDELPGGFGAPDYDSGWIAINPGEFIDLNHELETQSLFVYMVGRDFSGIVHQAYYGLNHDDGYYSGAKWSLSWDNNTIQIIRGDVDYLWDEVRVYIWIIP